MPMELIGQDSCGLCCRQSYVVSDSCHGSGGVKRVRLVTDASANKLLQEHY